MFIKSIVCSVSKSLKKEFSLAQEKWIGIKSIKGFIIQLGGWNLNDGTQACIISIWESETALKYFMKNLHDQIESKNKQDQFYSSIIVNHFNSILAIEGNSSTFKDAINNAKFLRIAECTVSNDKIKHFEEIQKNVWIPGMKSVNGMLGGFFSKSVKNINKYFVSTFWDSRENHKNYVNNILPRLRERADMVNDLEVITEKQIQLFDSWKIINEN